MGEQDRARWTRLVADFESSDLTQREFATERGGGITSVMPPTYGCRVLAHQCGHPSNTLAPPVTGRLPAVSPFPGHGGEPGPTVGAPHRIQATAPAEGPSLGGSDQNNSAGGFSVKLSSHFFFRTLAATSAAVVFAVAGGAAAQADIVSNTVVAGGSPSIVAGQSTSIGYFIQNQNNRDGDAQRSEEHTSELQSH